MSAWDHRDPLKAPAPREQPSDERIAQLLAQADWYAANGDIATAADLRAQAGEAR